MSLVDARAEMGIPVERADPCEQCGATLFAKEPTGIVCKNGKCVLPQQPTTLPSILQDLYTSPRAKISLRISGVYSNFASLNVEDAEDKKDIW